MNNSDKPLFSDCEESELENLGIKKIVDRLETLQSIDTSKERIQQMLNQFRYRSSSEASTVSNNCSSDEEIPEPKRLEEESEKLDEKEIAVAKNHSDQQTDNGKSEAKEKSGKESSDEMISHLNKHKVTVSEKKESNLMEDVRHLEHHDLSSDSIQEIVQYSSENPIQNVKLENSADGLVENDELPNPFSSQNLAVANPSSSSPLFSGSVRLISTDKSTEKKHEICRKIINSSSSSSSWTNSETENGIFESHCIDHQMEEQCSDDVLHFLDTRIDHRRQQLKKMRNRNNRTSLRENKLLRKLLLTKVNYLKMMVHVEKKRLKGLKNKLFSVEGCSVSE